MKFYFEEINKVLEKFNSTPNGLTSKEATNRVKTYGKNELAKEKKDSIIKKFINQLADPMTLVLLAAAGVSIGVSIYSGESFIDVFIILFVVFSNSILGVYQEFKAEKAIDALKKLSKSTTKIRRDGDVKSINTSEIVPGDIILFESGDAIPADARIIVSNSLKIEESALTGESVPIEKTSNVIKKNKDNGLPINDQKNMVYSGSTVAYGRGEAVVVATGMNTQMGSIAKFINKTVDEKTPLQKRLTHLGKTLSFIVIAICTFIFIFSLITRSNLNTENILDIFMISVSLAVAAIPSGLAAVVTIQLAIGVTKMAKHNAIIRKLTAVETLGCTQIICSDKTGTLTQNKMTVVEDFAFDKNFLSSAFVLCNDTKKDKNGNSIGDPTEVALFDFAKKSINSKNLEKRISEIPFDSNRKMMSTFHKYTKKIIQYTKGAPDVILQNCTHYIENSNIYKLNEKIRKEIVSKNKDMAQRALRVLAAACKFYDDMPQNLSSELCESKMIFVGLVGIIDPVRPEALKAVKSCKSAGILPIMITGDHKDTAVAIGKQLNIIENESQAITGVELDKISDKELKKIIYSISVYARVQPSHKVRIVECFKNLGKVVAMTGDGVNDAPSIKRADIGIGMGITGTDVTKNVADMILADDNFATIVSAVKEGRRIYDNIKKAVQFLLSSNISEIISIFVATVLGFKIFSPIHILWINLVTDTFPALCLGVEAEEQNLMNYPPRSESESLFAGGLTFNIIYQGFLISLITLCSYFGGVIAETGRLQIVDSIYGTSMAFFTMSMAETFHSFNARSLKNSILKLKSHNIYLIVSMIFSTFLINFVIYTPSLAKIFESTQIKSLEYFQCVALAFSIIPIVEVVKSFQRITQKYALNVNSNIKNAS